jgi:hypothetical protein
MQHHERKDMFPVHLKFYMPLRHSLATFVFVPATIPLYLVRFEYACLLTLHLLPSAVTALAAADHQQQQEAEQRQQR